MSNPEGLAIARRLIAEEAERQTGFLDLGKLGLTELPQEIHQLAHLRRLSLGGWFRDDEGNAHPSVNPLNPNDFTNPPLPQLNFSCLESITLNCALVSDLSPLSGLARLQLLDCGGTSVGDLSPLSGLTNLRSFICSNTKVSDLSPLSGLTNLQSLGCGTSSVSDLSPLSNLNNLTSLDCSNSPVSDLSPLAGLTQLQSLECLQSEVSDLGPLSQLLELQSFSCNFTRVRDLSPLSRLRRLQDLGVFHTLISDLSPLSQVTSLTSLLCGFCRTISDLSPLSNLANLQSLNCDATSVSNLAPLAGLSNLTHLNFGNTWVSDLSPLSGLINLQNINCRHTSVSDLSPLSGLPNLRWLEAEGCHFPELPHWLLREEPPIRLGLFKANIPGVPAEILSRDYGDDCRERLLAHVSDLTAGVEPVADVKVIVIGNGRIGKTQICNRLRGQAYDGQADSTHGITVTQASLPMPDDSQPALLNLWDFGGQDLYHGTHALFLKTRAVFVVVWTPFAENNFEYEHGGMTFHNQTLPYWLDYVRDAAGTVCPVILVQNQCDTPQDEVLQPPAHHEFLSAFPYLQQVHFSAKMNRKRDSLNEALREAIQYLRGQEGLATIGKGRLQVRQQLQQWFNEDACRERDCRKHRTLTLSQFHELCATVDGVSSPDRLLDYLHDTGAIYYRPGIFQDCIVLDQSWALDAIYTVFNRERCHRHLVALGGRFTRSLLQTLAWPIEEYSLAEQQLFLSLMESCGICFQRRAADHNGRFEAEYVAPDLLPDREHVLEQLSDFWDSTAAQIERGWRFGFLHPGLIRSVVSRVGQAAGDRAIYWKYGVCFHDATTRASAWIEQIMEDQRQGRIVLRCQGHGSDRLLNLVTEWIMEIIRRSGRTSFAIEGEPLPIRQEYGLSLFDWDDDLESRISIPVDFSAPPRSEADRQVYVSHAWNEVRISDSARADKVDEFCSRLTAAGVSVVTDDLDAGLSDRLGTFMRRIVPGDRVFVFLSEAYLKSPNCMDELLTIWQTCEDKQEFRLRTRVYTMPGADVFSILARLKHAAYWKEQRDNIQRVIDENGVDMLGLTDFLRFVLIRKFADHVDEMLAQIVDGLQPCGFDDHIGHAIDEFNSGESSRLVENRRLADHASPFVLMCRLFRQIADWGQSTLARARKSALVRAWFGRQRDGR